jgi:tetratricopeptide (TPR) repeat protein
LLRDVKLHFKLRDWEGAVPLLEQLIEISPGKALYRGMLGRALSRHPSRRKEAETQFVEALRLSPRDPEIHYWLGLYYKSFGLGSRALNEFRTTLRIDPRHEGARKQLGASGKPDDALGSVIKKIFG